MIPRLEILEDRTMPSHPFPAHVEHPHHQHHQHHAIIQPHQIHHAADTSMSTVPGVPLSPVIWDEPPPAHVAVFSGPHSVNFFVKSLRPHLRKIIEFPKAETIAPEELPESEPEEPDTALLDDSLDVDL